MKKYWFRKMAMFIIFFLVAATFFSGVVMLLWNAVLHPVLGVKLINFCQALGILVLSKILFGGFHGCHGRHRHHWKQQMKEKWENMTPEEREKFKSEWKHRCSGRFKNNPGQFAEPSAE